MDRLAYASISAMRAAMARQTVTASNLANVDTPGFRAEMTSAQSLWMGGAGNARAFASEEVRSADMKEGAVNHTGRPLDVALQKDALLTVQAADGTEAYTRRGDLQVNESGLLTTGDGKAVMGEGGPITLPPNDKVFVDQDGQVSIVPTGGDPKSAPEQVDRIKLVTPAGSNIAKGTDGLFRVTGGGTLPTDPDARLTSGALEGSNVTATQALVEMIDAQRSWETQVKMLSTAKDMDTSATQLMQLPD